MLDTFSKRLKITCLTTIMTWSTLKDAYLYVVIRTKLEESSSPLQDKRYVVRSKGKCLIKQITSDENDVDRS